jgi:transposase InsO family protein
LDVERKAPVIAQQVWEQPSIRELADEEPCAGCADSDDDEPVEEIGDSQRAVSDIGGASEETVGEVTAVGAHDEDVDEDEVDEDVRVAVRLLIKGQPLTAVVDTGAFNLWMDKRTFDQHGGEEFEPVQSGATAVDGKPLEVMGQGRVSFVLWGRTFRGMRVRVMRSMPSHMLIGRKFLRKVGMVLDHRQGSGHFWAATRDGKARFSGSTSETPVLAGYDEAIAVVVELDVDSTILEMDLREFGGEKDREALRAVLWRHREVFRPVRGLAVGEEFVIHTKEGADLSTLDRPTYRKSPLERETERREVERLIQQGVLEPSTSPYGTNNVFVKKKLAAGETQPALRVTADLRALNAVTVGDAYPTEDVKEIVGWLATKRWFSVMDVRESYWNISLAPGSRELTAVKTVCGLFHYTRMTMGAKNAAAYLQRVMNVLFQDRRRKDVAAYQDDVSVGTETPGEHVDSLDVVLGRLVRKGLRLKLAKCSFGRESVEVLGHRVRFGEVVPSDRHLQAIRNFREPSNASELLRFLGLINFFSEFIESAADRMRPLYRVLDGTPWNRKKRKGATIRVPDWAARWGLEQRMAFEDLRTEMGRPEFLVPARPGADKRMVTDASRYGFGAVLLQLEGARGWQPVGFASRKLTGGEPRWTTTERECGAVVFGLRKFRHLLHGERFTVVTDHTALGWLMNLREPRERLARWIIGIQEMDFAVMYAPGNGDLMAVPDALSRDTMERDLVFCAKCLESVGAVDEEATGAGIELDEMVREQGKEFGPAAGAMRRDEAIVELEDGLLAKVSDDGRVRVIVPASLKERVLGIVHGSKTHGHWGTGRTAARLGRRYYWVGMFADVAEHVHACLACRLVRERRPGRQARMMRYHPTRRFEVVAMDLCEISPTSRSGMKKVLVIGDLFTRFMLAVPVGDELASTVARVLLDRWVLLFGPPERILSDKGKTFVGNVVANLCKMVGVKKIFTSPYHPQTDGCVERWNRTLCEDLRKFVLAEDEWDQHVAMSTFRYNTSVHSATGQTPYRGMFGVDAFDFDAGLGLQLRLDEEPTDLPTSLARLHEDMLRGGLRSRDRAARHYDRAVDETMYQEGDRVLVYHPPALTERGRKLRVPWLGPYVVKERLSAVGYVLESVLGGKRARVHVNRLRKIDSETLQETEDPREGMWPDTRRVLRGLVDERMGQAGAEFKVRSRGRSGFTWRKEEDLPDIAVKAYRMSRESGP